jgi:hypothetical protein
MVISDNINIFKYTIIYITLTRLNSEDHGRLSPQTGKELNAKFCLCQTARSWKGANLDDCFLFQ